MILCGQSNVFASDTSLANSQHKPFQEVRNEIQRIQALFSNGSQFSFIEIKQTQKGKETSRKRHLSISKSGQETLSPAESESGNGLNWQMNMLFDTTLLPQRSSLINETDETWVFRIPPKIQADVNEQNQEVDQVEINKKLASAIKTEMTISKHTPRVISIKTYSESAFKPQSLVTVDTFNVRIDYKQAWQEGPFVATSISRSVQGSYAFFIDINEVSITQFEQFTLVQN